MHSIMTYQNKTTGKEDEILEKMGKLGKSCICDQDGNELAFPCRTKKGNRYRLLLMVGKEKATVIFSPGDGEIDIGGFLEICSKMYGSRMLLKLTGNI